jgi:hypothetical protein
LYIVEDLEDATHEKVKEFLNLITDQERIRGENMKNNTDHFSYRIASNVIRLIKDGYVQNVIRINWLVQNVDAALDYTMVKTGISFNMLDDKKLLVFLSLFVILMVFLMKISYYNSPHYVFFGQP